MTGRAALAIRSTLYGSAFVGTWAAVAIFVRRWDAALGGPLPSALRPLGAGLALAGAALGLACVVAFVVSGRGTPAPFDAPRAFVGVGPYRAVRNPMYVGGLGMLGGSALWLGSPAQLALTAVAGALAHAFVTGYEEPVLRRRFGDSYERYCRETGRWWPRRRRD